MSLFRKKWLFLKITTPLISQPLVWLDLEKIPARSKPKLLHFCHMLQMFLSLLRKELYLRNGKNKIIHNKKDHIFDQNISFSGVFILYKSGPFKVDQKVNIVITHIKSILNKNVNETLAVYVVRQSLVVLNPIKSNFYVIPKIREFFPEAFTWIFFVENQHI